MNPDDLVIGQRYFYKMLKLIVIFHHGDSTPIHQYPLYVFKYNDEKYYLLTGAVEYEIIPLTDKLLAKLL